MVKYYDGWALVETEEDFEEWKETNQKFRANSRSISFPSILPYEEDSCNGLKQSSMTFEDIRKFTQGLLELIE